MCKNSSTPIFFTKFIILLLFVIGFFENTQAQSQSFTLEGRVLDPAGASVVMAKVTLQNTGQKFEAITNSDGIYKLHPGLVMSTGS